jgi:hypothetical protein
MQTDLAARGFDLDSLSLGEVRRFHVRPPAPNDIAYSKQIEGGFRISTDTPQPDAMRPEHAAVTVFTNNDRDSVSVDKNGSYWIYNDGEDVAFGDGDGGILSGDVTVGVGVGGSAVEVQAFGHNGRKLYTTLRATGDGVEVIASVGIP